MENNKDLMGWNAPGSNNSSDEDKQKNTDPWGRTVKRNNDPVQEILNLLKNFLGNRKNGSGGSSKQDKPSFNLIGLIVAVILGFYIFSGFYTVREAEKGVVLRFGKVYNVVDSGLRWKFSGIDSVNVVDIEQVRSIQSSGTMLTEVKRRFKDILGKSCPRAVQAPSTRPYADAGVVPLNGVWGLWIFRRLGEPSIHRHVWSPYERRALTKNR